MTFGPPEPDTPVCEVRDCPGFGTKHGQVIPDSQTPEQRHFASRRGQLDATRVLSTAGETIATYGCEWYPGHVATVVFELNPHLSVQSTEDGGKTWQDVTDRTVPYA